MSKRIEIKLLVDRFTKERDALYEAQLVNWRAAKNPFEAWKKWVSAGETMARVEANTALTVQIAQYVALK